ncbi:MAG: polymer-forming cytoskeletal protein [Eubacteriales bacterium]|nr:polymer-forming cytoskeletal protein [Eubacteriales bacterium]
MSFFKDFKDDLSEEVKSLYGDDIEKEAEEDKDEDLMVNTLDDPELAKMAESLKKEVEESPISDKLDAELNSKTEDKEMNAEPAEEKDSEVTQEADTEEIADETAVITEGLTVKGDLDSIGSIDLFGSVDGNITCRGKLTVSGSIFGSSKANEVFANNAQIEGDIEAKGSVKIGQGTVIVGNISATSAVIAGAVKGDIDVHGPVIVDSSAIVVGDIKSKTVQINNGATIDGRCSQCYADVNTDSIFNLKNKKSSK